MEKNKLKEILEVKFTSAQRLIGEFEVALKANASHAMEWSDKVFFAAAEIEIYKTVVDALKENGTVEIIKEFSASKVQSYAEFPPCSSSNSSNRMEAARARAYAKILDLIKWG